MNVRTTLIKDPYFVSGFNSPLVKIDLIGYFLNLVIMIAEVKEIRETKNGNNLYRVCIADDLVVETDTELQVSVFNAQVISIELAKRMSKAIDSGKKVTLNFALAD